MKKHAHQLSTKAPGLQTQVNNIRQQRQIIHIPAVPNKCPTLSIHSYNTRDHTNPADSWFLDVMAMGAMPMRCIEGWWTMLSWLFWYGRYQYYCLLLVPLFVLILMFTLRDGLSFYGWLWCLIFVRLSPLSVSTWRPPSTRKTWCGGWWWRGGWRAGDRGFRVINSPFLRKRNPFIAKSHCRQSRRRPTANPKQPANALANSLASRANTPPSHIATPPQIPKKLGIHRKSHHVRSSSTLTHHNGDTPCSFQGTSDQEKYGRRSVSSIIYV